jgi:hypothetical protein
MTRPDDHERLPWRQGGDPLPQLPYLLVRCGATLREAGEIYLEPAEFGPDGAEVRCDVVGPAQSSITGVLSHGGLLSCSRAMLCGLVTPINP